MRRVFACLIGTSLLLLHSIQASDPSPAVDTRCWLIYDEKPSTTTISADNLNNCRAAATGNDTNYHNEVIQDAIFVNVTDPRLDIDCVQQLEIDLQIAFTGMKYAGMYLESIANISSWNVLLAATVSDRTGNGAVGTCSFMFKLADSTPAADVGLLYLDVMFLGTRLSEAWSQALYYGDAGYVTGQIRFKSESHPDVDADWRVQGSW
ncbi:hypothetical protein F5Y15DRAFT_420370 [Xylariaceae sp. FL0016]|nr:hypothetical protein F5Y15DRAFT_420370 [Xylariaceae sp. FL0016]